MSLLLRIVFSILLTGVVIALQFCTRKDISFGDTPENEYTSLVYTDTVGIQLSTVVSDSFSTNSTTNFLMGRYKDPFLGTTTGKPFFQLTKPTEIPEIPASAVFDSLTLIIKPNDYYYGDTSLIQTVYVHELANAIAPVYSGFLFNTSTIPVKPLPLGSKTTRIFPAAHDSLIIRLNDAKGSELFTHLRQQSVTITNETEFQNYFYGISLSLAATDTTALYGVSGEAGSIIMRLHYHTTIPLPESKYVDFASLANANAFNQLQSSRPAALMPGNSGKKEVLPAVTGGYAFTQPGTGMYLKMTFPSLRNLVINDDVAKIVHAELIIRPSSLSFNSHQYKLPSGLYLITTDRTNDFISEVLDSTLSATQYVSPVIDHIYGENNYYRFNVTSYISSMLFTPGSGNDGFFIGTNEITLNASRLVVNEPAVSTKNCQLLLTLLKIKKENR